MLQRVAVSLVMLATIIFGLQFLPTAADGADKCPSITVTGVAEDGRSALFSANVTSLNENLTYKLDRIGGHHHHRSRNIANFGFCY